MRKVSWVCSEGVSSSTWTIEQVYRGTMLWLLYVLSCQQQAQNDSDHCQNYRILMLCLDDPECVFCNRGSELGMSSCVHRSRSEVSMLWEELQVTCNFTSVGIFCSCCLKQGWLLALWNKIQTCKQFIYFFKGMLILMRQCKQVHIFRICPFFKATKWHVNGDKWKYANLVRVCDEGQNWSPLYLY